METFRRHYRNVLDAAKEGKAWNYFQDFYNEKVPHANPQDTKPFISYLLQRNAMYCHQGWDPLLAKTDAVMDCIDAVVDNLQQQRFSRMRN